MELSTASASRPEPPSPPSSRRPPPPPPRLPALMQTALFIRRNPPSTVSGPRLPFADELRAAALKHAHESEDLPLTPPAEASLSPSSSPSPSPSSPRLTFSALPAEIRNAIWTEALPRRVIGLRPHNMDEGDTTPAGGGTIPCYGVTTRPTARHGSGSRMPQALASTCYESRAAVTRSGRWTIGAEGMPVWFDPKRDIILLNSRRPVDYFLLARRTMLTDPPPRPPTPTDPHGAPVEDNLLFDVPVLPPAGPAAPLSTLPPASEDPVGFTYGGGGPRPLDPTSTVSIADLAQHQLVGCLDEAVRSGGGIAVHHELLRSHVGRVIFPLLKTCATVAGRPDLVGASLMVYFDEIAVTGTRAQAVASGLFGTAAAPEEQMFFVPLSDRETLERILAASKVRPGHSPPQGGAFRTTSGVCRSLGGLRVGNAGFIRELLRPSHAMHNLRMLATRYLWHSDHWAADLDSEPSEVLIARAMEAGMPPLEQAILFRFKEVAEGEEYR
ncbi:hypothetical protein SBRCBS47491_002145 [Sporothrix bragantina]|uniref:2EXR domain-containing protein n=1 Tax=Sporothrix bragantina TaxID=671064 RepID=A0ABP0B528_9PEZI